MESLINVGFKKLFSSLDCPISEPMLRYFIDRSAYAYQERRDGKDETIDLYQIAIFIKQIAFASMEVGVSKETIDPRLFLQQWGKAGNWHQSFTGSYGRYEARGGVIRSLQ